MATRADQRLLRLGQPSPAWSGPPCKARDQDQGHDEEGGGEKEEKEEEEAVDEVDRAQLLFMTSDDSLFLTCSCLVDLGS